MTSVNIFMLLTPISTFLLLVQVDPSEKLDPEVEDILMDIADEFVESVCNQTEIYYIISMFQTIGFLLLKNCSIGVIIIIFFLIVSIYDYNFLSPFSMILAIPLFLISHSLPSSLLGRLQHLDAH